ncbi:MAG TPA: two-component regulator propeller domain-containing protein [Chitinophagaceae bacterium]|nr:two-component regulator propeller domain-containing protein [Chitinophagaceae bacterium]
MIITAIRTYMIIALLAVATNGLSQTTQIKFNLVPGTNGVSLGKINGMIRDSKGFMWFSDQTFGCIVRFDGSHMTKFVYDPNNPNSLGGYYPECLESDTSGNIWIGFYGMGLDKFDPATNSFTHYRYDKNDAASLSSDSVSVVRVDHLGNVWVGSFGGLDLLDQKTGKFKHYRNKADDTTSLSNNIVRAIYEDKEGELWIGTGFTFDGTDEGGLNRFNRSHGTFTRYMHDPANPATLIDNKVRAILEDSYGNFWIGTRHNGLHTLDRKTGRVTRYPLLPSKMNGLGSPSPSIFIDNITFLVEDVDRKIWIGTMFSGIIRYDPQTKVMTHYGAVDDKGNFSQDGTSWWAHATQDGIVWISTQNANLFRVDLRNVIIPFVVVDPINDGVRALNEESPTAVWYATATGLLRKDGNGSTKQFLNEPGNANSLSSNNVFSLLRDRSGNLWIGASNALNFYDNKQDAFRRYYYKGDNLPGPSPIISLCQDTDSNIWIGTDGAGLYKFNSGTNKFTGYQHSPVNGNTISENVINSILADGDRTLWIGTGKNGGLDKLDLQTGKFIHHLPGMTINCLYKNVDGILWVGAAGGLFHYEPKLDRFASLAEVNVALNIVDVKSVIADKENNLWVCAESGLYMINKARDRLIRFGQANGLSDANNFFHNNAAILLQNGELQFGFGHGYCVFDPANLEATPAKSRLYFTGLWLNNKIVNPGDGGPLKEPINIAREIRLRYRQNIFAISATMIDFSIGGDKRVFYKLENYDKDWRSTNPEEPMQYLRIPPGRYLFRVRIAAGIGEGWQERSIVILILPPWWSTWWAYCVYAGLFTTLVLYVHRYQKNRVISAERERTRAKQLEQAKEIEKAYHELKTTQTQLIQQEKMASLGELTAGIAHEIQNPLNFVNNFSEVNTELINELEQEADKGNIEEVKAIAKNIKGNEQKINQHGKRADSIVKGMLQHSRTSSGQREATDINVLCDEYLRLAYHGLRAKDKSFNAKLETNFDNSIGKINIVQQDMGRVILNLINNAFYAVGEKQKRASTNSGLNGYEPCVIVKTNKINDKIEIKIKDNGNGISQKLLEKIFQPFFTTKPTGQGTGLGLSLAYDVIKAHGGEIKVNTKEGDGSEFTIELPGQ